MPPAIALTLTAEDPLQDGVEVTLLTTATTTSTTTITTTTTSTTTLSVGSLVQLHGLQSRADLNGDVGRVAAPLLNGRHKVELLSTCTDKLQAIAVRPANLLLLRVNGTAVAGKPCKHYRRTCCLVCPDCEEKHECRMCHDQKWDLCT